MEILVRKNLTKKNVLKKLTKKDRRDDRGGEEERKETKERGRGRAKRARWCVETWEEGRGAKRAREAQGRAKREDQDNYGYQKNLLKKMFFYLF